MQFRTEKDALGEKKIPSNAYFGIFSQRAFENFRISGTKADLEFIKAIVSIKIASAKANAKLSMLDGKIAKAIIHAGNEILRGKFSEQFIVDSFQAGAGTSSNMNVNEVIANRANEILGEKLGAYSKVHPNDHVNFSQSSNDIGPTAIRIAALKKSKILLKELFLLQKSFEKKSKEFENIIKTGRTHLQDAVPVTLGQEFECYAFNLKKNIKRIGLAFSELEKICLGGTAVGSGLNSHSEFKNLVSKKLSAITELNLSPAENLFEELQFSSDLLFASNSLACFAVDLGKTCNDLRLLSSGPNCGFNELILPAVQPGSSIMPGKVNPSIPEMANMVCFQVQGNNHAIELCAGAGQLELNAMTPTICHNLLQSIELLSNASKTLREKCIDGIKANGEVCAKHFGHSSSIATILAPKLGYAKTAGIAKQAVKENRTVREILLEKKLFSKKEIDKLFVWKKLIKPNLEGKKK